jgi:hypothetical protein
MLPLYQRRNVESWKGRTENMAKGEMIYRYGSDTYQCPLDDGGLLIVRGPELRRVQKKQGKEYKEMLNPQDWLDRVDGQNVRIVETQGDGRGQWK